MLISPVGTQPSKTKLDVFHRDPSPKYIEGHRERVPVAFDWRTWSSSRCYENSAYAARSCASRDAGHTCADRLTLHEWQLHTRKLKLDIGCIWFLRHTVRDRIFSLRDYKNDEGRLVSRGGL